jgi:protein-S-isoprenylcysteine O-methyltransferase Ste14
MGLGTIWRIWLPLVAGLLGIALIFQNVPGPQGSIRLLGMLLALFGLAGIILSRHTLGRSFSVTPKATALVTTGIYSRIRNPIYVFGIIFIVGLIVMAGKPYLLVVPLVLGCLQIVRARQEAAVLEAKFGNAYREYRDRTWF